MPKTDLTYPPDRKRPRGENRRAVPAKQNAYRGVPDRPARPAAQGGISSKWLLAALAGGAALAWFKASAGSGAVTGAAIGADTGATTGAGNGTSNGAGSGTPTPTQLPARPAVIGPLQPGRLVFVQSMNGETIYERLRQTGSFPEGYGLPSSAIEHVANGTWLGYLTGRNFQPKPSYPNMLQVYATTGDGRFRCNFWVDAEEVVVLGQTDADAYIRRGLGKHMSAELVQAIQGYFATRYRS